MSADIPCFRFFCILYILLRVLAAVDHKGNVVTGIHNVKRDVGIAALPYVNNINNAMHLPLSNMHDIEVEVNEKSNGSDVANVVNNVANVANDYELTDLDKAIYKWIASNTHASTKEIAEAVRVTVRSVQRSVKKLEKHQIIKKAGTRNKIDWIILK